MGAGGVIRQFLAATASTRGVRELYAIVASFFIKAHGSRLGAADSTAYGSTSVV
jgi:hypothetical protein